MEPESEADVREILIPTRILPRNCGPVDQLEDRYLGMVEAVGSNPTRSTATI